ncbi:MAG: histidine phosphatase family protein [Actinomycetota bacterium]|nr:histidine phosphatase family protein [Actinomycetota bacterium]
MSISDAAAAASPSEGRSAIPASGSLGRLVLLRHGETDWSRTGRHTGLTDVPLTDDGEVAARRAGTLLSGWTFVRVLVSPLERARRTAELAGLAGIELDARLVEWDYGGYEGLTTPEIRSRLGHDWTVFGDGVVPGTTPGETLEGVAARAAAVLADVRADLDRGDVAVVAHAHLLRILTTVFLGADPELAGQLLLDSGSVSVLDHEHGRPAIRRWNLLPPSGEHVAQAGVPTLSASGSGVAGPR